MYFIIGQNEYNFINDMHINLAYFSKRDNI